MRRQGDRAMEQLRLKATDLEKYLYLRTLKNTASTLFYRILLDHMDVRFASLGVR